MEMISVRCKSPHPKLVGRPCNGMVKVQGDWVGQLSIGCPRCYGYINITREQAGTEDTARQNEPIAIS